MKKTILGFLLATIIAINIHSVNQVRKSSQNLNSLFKTAIAEQETKEFENRKNRYIPQADCYLQCVDPHSENCTYIINWDRTC